MGSDDTFSFEMVSTIGVDFKTKFIKLDGQVVKLQVWDTAGQERFHNITKATYRGAKGILIVYDVTKEASFKHVKTWMEKIRQNGDESVSVMIVGNKCDSAKRVISHDRGEELSEKYNVKFIETSAMNNTNITKAFTQIAKEAKRNCGSTIKPNNDDPSKVKINGRPTPPPEGGGGCC